MTCTSPVRDRPADRLPSSSCSSTGNDCSSRLPLLHGPSQTASLIPALIVLFVLTGICTADSAGTTSSGQVTNPTDIVWGPWITGTTSTSTIIHWKTECPVRGGVDFILPDMVPGGVWDTAQENEPSLMHKVCLTGLSPGGQYLYRISGTNRTCTFRLYPPDGPVSFVVYGDTREQLPLYSQENYHAKVAGRIAGETDCFFVIHTGDMVNDPADDGEWGRFFAAAGTMLANVTFYPVPGNHEGNLTKYSELFGMPPYYSVQCAGNEFIVLDSNPLPPSVSRMQDSWFDNITGESPGKKFVFIHTPPFTSDPDHWGGFADIQRKWVPLFTVKHISAVFSAHVHAYEHYESGGIHYFVVATGGAPPYPLAGEKPGGFRYSMEDTLAYARVTVNPVKDRAVIEIVRVGEMRGNGIVMSPPSSIAERIVIGNRNGVIPWMNFNNMFESALFPTIPHGVFFSASYVCKYIISPICHVYSILIL
jgi:acid phosphatase type 7